MASERGRAGSVAAGPDAAGSRERSQAPIALLVNPKPLKLSAEGSYRDC